jgi:hypothetical protein
MTTQPTHDVETEFENRFTGYLVLWGDPVPGHPGIHFHNRAVYNVPAMTGYMIADVGEVWSLQKDGQGLFVVVRLKKDAVVPAGQLEWVHTVSKVELSGYALDPDTGQPRQQLVKYMIDAIYVKAKHNARPSVNIIG